VRRGAEKWLKQAEADLKAAEDSLEDGHMNGAVSSPSRPLKRPLRPFFTKRDILQ
jgi:hypothetical protein